MSRNIIVKVNASAVIGIAVEDGETLTQEQLHKVAAELFASRCEISMDGLIDVIELVSVEKL